MAHMANNAGFTVWMTGMLGAGKSTMAKYIAARLRQVGRNVEILDEDDLDELYWGEVEDNREGRALVTRRMGGMAEMLSRNGTAALVACVSPYKSVREEMRRNIGRFIEVFVDCPTDKLMQRDSSGKYKKALAGEIPNFVGITDPYEPPSSPEVMHRSDVDAVEVGGAKVFQWLLDLKYLDGEELKVIMGKKIKANSKPQRVKLPPKSKKPAAAPAKASAKAAPPKPKKKK